ncbi:MAG: class I SAM-dependent methyltransferase [Atopobiaceae bacterium]|nr:class I SAM-dependent methyltransferase [Atopobiaceae bacterium]
MLPRLRPDRLHQELLVRAARVRGIEAPVAVDATAGLGEDGLLLAAAGFTVVLCEHDAVIAALLEDALARALDDPRLVEVARRMTLVADDSARVLARMDVAPDVVYLDPMFPERRRKAATNKKLQLFQQLEQPCKDEEGLLRAALEARPRKVVVKRPLKGPYLAGVKPSSSLEGKVVRYDVIVPAR